MTMVLPRAGGVVPFALSIANTRDKTRARSFRFWELLEDACSYAAAREYRNGNTPSDNKEIPPVSRYLALAGAMWGGQRVFCSKRERISLPLFVGLEEELRDRLDGVVFVATLAGASTALRAFPSAGATGVSSGFSNQTYSTSEMTAKITAVTGNDETA